MVDNGGDVGIAIIDDDAFGVIIAFFFHLGNNIAHIGSSLESSGNLAVFFKKLDCVEALEAGGDAGRKTTLDGRDSLFCYSGERNWGRHSCRANGLKAVHHLVDAFVLQCGDLNHIAAELFSQLVCMDFVTALTNDVHHIDGNDNRYAHLKKLRSEVQIALKIAAVNDVQDGIGLS